MLLFIVLNVCVSFVAAVSMQGYSLKLAQPQQFPYQAALKVYKVNRKITHCGGSLISKNWVLTAGSCIEIAINVTVKLGIVDYTKAAVTMIVSKKNLITHPYFSYIPLWADVGLIKIPTVTLTADIQPIQLPKIRFTYSRYVNEKCIVTGWDRVNSKRNDVKQLKYFQSKVIADDFKWGKYDFNTECLLCTSSVNNDACAIEKGNPLVLESRQLQIGINSFGKRKCFSEAPPTFTRLTCYLSWIRNHTGIWN